MKLLIFVSVLTLSQAQIPFDSVSQKPWDGPLADHQIGIHPGDTPEVAAAKSQHLKAYQDVLAVLPELAPEDSYIIDDSPLPAVRASQEHVHQRQVNFIQNLEPVTQTQRTHIHPVFSNAQPQKHIFEVETTPDIPTVFAEDIPRSPIGEVPEVHAARVAHLKAVQEARAGSRF